jgi:uncharacterized membrane protein YhiD involved in acid resistance
MLDFFSTYSKIENPTLEMVLFTFILSFLLSALVAFTYEKTTFSTVKHYGLMQTFILSSLIATMVLQAIGDNVASGLGMLGALTVVQFRTTLRNPRDMIFVFAALGAGIACGLYGWRIAILGTLFFCTVAFLIRFSPFHFSHLPIWNLKLKGEDWVFLSDDFKQIMSEYCKYETLEGVEREKDGTKLYHFSVMLKSENQQRDLFKAFGYLKINVYTFNRKKDK